MDMYSPMAASEMQAELSLSKTLVYDILFVLCFTSIASLTVIFRRRPNMLSYRSHRGITSFSPNTFLLVLSLLLLSAVAQSSNAPRWIPFDQEQFENNIALDTKGNVQLFWKMGDVYSTYGIASRSSGYLALGFSETGAMTGADIAVGRKDDSGKFVLENRHAGGFFTPQLSKDQEVNIRLKQGNQTDGVTWFIFEKKNSAVCLEEQADVHLDSWQWFIYAFSDDNTFQKHQPGHNGKQYVKLGTGKTVFRNEVRAIPDSENFTITQPEITVSTDETTYCYTLHKLPGGKKNYILGEMPATSSKLLHHLVVYSCYNLPERTKSMIGQKPNCDYKNFENPCTGFVTEWAPGMSGKTFEPGFGKPFGSDSYEYVMLETHYNNPNAVSNEKSAAGYTFVYNDKPVDTEIGSLTLGDLQVTGWTLEPGKKLVSHSTVCTPECTSKWPSKGITAVSVFHHMHLRGRNARVQIVRGGKEIAALSSLRAFEYGYQYSKSLNEVKLLPGDRLITTCQYDTSEDTEPVPGGLASKDEMCFAWVDYYPANAVLACTQFNLGQSPKNPLNGTAAVCVEASKPDPDIYASDSLNSTFHHLPAAGNSCNVSASPTTVAGTSGTDAPPAASSTKSSGSATYSPSYLLYHSLWLTWFWYPWHFLR